MSKIRDISPGLQVLRNFLLGRQHKMALRFEKDLAPRTADPPNLPEGPAHILSANYYYARDARREVHPPKVLTGPAVAGSITAGETKEAAPVVKKGKTPGVVYLWD